MLVIYVIYLGTGWVHSRRVRTVEREKKKVQFKVYLSSCKRDIFMLLFWSKFNRPEMFTYVNIYTTNRCWLYINFHEILSRSTIITIMNNSKE